MPYSLKGLANIVLTARLTSEQRDRISAERETKTIAMFFTFVGGSYNWIGKKTGNKWPACGFLCQLN